MDITKIGSLADYIREFEMEKAEEEKNEQEGKLSSGIKAIFTGDEAPTKETLDSFADENDMTFDEVLEKVLVFAFDGLKEEKEESNGESEEGNEEDESEESEGGFTPKKSKGSSGSTGSDAGLKSAKAYGGMNGGGKFVNEDEDPTFGSDDTEESDPVEETQNPFNVGDFVSVDTDDHENMFYGKKLEVTNVDGDFVQVLLVDPNGIETEMWFKADEVREEVKASSDEDNTENVEETDVMEADDVADDREEELEESFGIYSHLQKYLAR